ncbi:tetratricopeptide repeat protein [Clostridium amazonitimonense]|uniref:tetratricopeptide repeat protein n=1 Tax=Clostridium amazonitimonense TaxID=1499689 RepID=UPI0005099F25|nr:tetratricopeptide repeat protein [Clostridium amazonitimonense]
MFRKSKKVSILLICIILLTGCNAYEAPSSFIASPKLSTEEGKNAYGNVNMEDLKPLAQKFMPKNAKLLEESKTSTKKNIFLIDVNGDLNDELVVLFKEDSNFKKGFFVLEKRFNGWHKIYEKSLEGNSISSMQTISVKDKEDKRLLVGYLISGHAGTDFYLYDFKKENVEEIPIGRWNKIEILNTEDKEEGKNFVFGAQLYEASGDYSSYVIGFDGEKFYLAEEFYDDYYKKNVEYYKNEIVQQSRNELSWYYYIESQIKAKQYEDALQSLKEVLKYKEDKKEESTIEVGYYKFLILRAMAFNGLGEYDKAVSILENLLNISLLSDKDYFYNEPKEYSVLDIYYELGVAYKGLGKKDKAKEAFDNAMLSFEKLSNDGFFSENATSNILKQVMYYPLSKEINK